jgi:hypothetical protein
VVVRFYVDADILSVAKLLVQVRADVTFPGDPGAARGIDGFPRPACPFNPGEKDDVWIPAVATQGWVVITRDRHIRSRPAERKAVKDSAARIITLDARRKLNTWDAPEIVVTQWRKIEELTELPGPWVYTASRSGCRRETL